MADAQDRAAPPVDAGQRAMDRLFRWIVAKRLQAPAAMVLEMHRPLAPPR